MLHLLENFSDVMSDGGDELIHSKYVVMPQGVDVSSKITLVDYEDRTALNFGAVATGQEGIALKHHIPNNFEVAVVGFRVTQAVTATNSAQFGILVDNEAKLLLTMNTSDVRVQIGEMDDIIATSVQMGTCIDVALYRNASDDNSNLVISINNSPAYLVNVDASELVDISATFGTLGNTLGDLNLQEVAIATTVFGITDVYIANKRYGMPEVHNAPLNLHDTTFKNQSGLAADGIFESELDSYEFTAGHGNVELKVNRDVEDPVDDALLTIFAQQSEIGADGHVDVRIGASVYEHIPDDAISSKSYEFRRYPDILIEV